MSRTFALADDPWHGGRLGHRLQWLAEGVSRRRLASSEFTTVLPGHQALTADPPALARVADAVLAGLGEGGGAISHETAAELWGLPLPPRFRTSHTGVIHLTLPAGAGARSTDYRRVHRRRSGHSPSRVMVGGLMLEPISLTLCRVAARLTLNETVAALDAMLCPGRISNPAWSSGALLREVENIGHLRGARAVRRALPLARENVESPWETHTRLLLLSAGYPEPVANLPVTDPVTGSRFRLDLAFPLLRIAIEYDGDWHRTDRSRFRRDRMKDSILARMGWVLIRITIDQLMRPAPFLRHLAAVTAERSAA